MTRSILGPDDLHRAGAPILWKRRSWYHPKKLYMKVNPHSTAAKGFEVQGKYFQDPLYPLKGGGFSCLGIIIPDRMDKK